MLVTLLSIFTFSNSVVALTTSYEGAVMECGKWTDVPSSYKPFYTAVCETGIMVGMDETQFGDDKLLSRAAAAVIGNRLAMTASAYESSTKTGAFYKSYLDGKFTDVPPNEWWNEWILKAMYYANFNEVMKGDGDKSPTTFRATDEVNAAEFLKIIYESAKKSDSLVSPYNDGVNYEKSPWYTDLVLKLRDAAITDNYSLTGSGFIKFKLYHENDLKGDYHVYTIALDKKLTRQDAAAILHAMLIHEFIVFEFDRY